MRRSLPIAVALLALLSSQGASAAGLTSLLRRESSLLATLEGLVGQVVRAESELSRLERERKLLDYEQAEARRRIKALEKRAGEREAQVRRRLTGIYKLSRGRYLRLLVEAKDRRDLLLRAAALKQILRRDLDELLLYRREMAKLKGQRERLEASASKQRQLLAALVAQQAGLASARKSRALLLARVRRSRRLRQQVDGELTRVQRALLARVAHLEVRLRNAGGFAGRKGKLPRPVGGAIVGAFGRITDQQTGLPVLRSGVTFRPYRRVRARAVHPGIVRLARPVPGYGNLVLIDHGEAYYTLYGFLASLDVKVGDRVRLGTVLGRSGDDPLDGRSALYFELRQKERPLDPREWFRR